MLRVASLTIFLFAFLIANAQTDPGDLVINEFMASNDSLSGLSDSNGGYADWVEIYNTTSNPILLTGYMLSDSIPDPGKWEFPAGTIINPNSYLVIWCDGDITDTKGIHSNFNLAKEGEELILSAPNGTVLDQYVFPEQFTSVSAARMPNGTGDFEFTFQTQKASNDIERQDPVGTFDLVINEFMAESDSASGIAEPNGGYPDWIEIYNNTNQTVRLSGYYLSDTLLVKRKWAFPADAEIEPNGFLIVWADTDVHQFGIHSNFRLSSFGEEIILSHENGSVIDQVVFGQQSLNLSYARKPNGTGAFEISTHTFNADNTPVSIETYLNQDFNIIQTQDYLQIINPSGKNINVFDLSGKIIHFTSAINSTFSLSSLNPGIYIIRNETGQFRRFIKL